MSGLQIFFIALTFLGPVVTWRVSRHLGSEKFDRDACRAVAVVLLCTMAAEFTYKIVFEDIPPGRMLPMQLCDWALVATAGALWFRWRVCFEAAYFWGLSGTLQALFTPELTPDIPMWRQSIFFLAHSGIVGGVLLLMLALKMRPVGGSVLRTIAVTEIYVASALTVNALTGQNYGFHAHKPITPSLLDLFSDSHWIYVAQIQLAGVCFFAALYLPWWIADRVRASSKVSS